MQKESDLQAKASSEWFACMHACTYFVQSTAAAKLYARACVARAQAVAELEVPCGPQSAAVERSAVCFTDLPRSTSLTNIPGGAVCFASNPAVWQAFRAIVRAVEPCAA